MNDGLDLSQIRVVFHCSVTLKIKQHIQLIIEQHEQILDPLFLFLINRSD
jgi:hypothetical protein